MKQHPVSLEGSRTNIVLQRQGKEESGAKLLLCDGKLSSWERHKVNRPPTGDLETDDSIAKRPSNRRPREPRRGHLILAVLVCLSVISLILVGSLTHGLRLHRQIRKERMLEQTRWVLDAGISRAVKALDRDLSYSGETLELKEPLHEHKSVVKISVDRTSPEKAIFVTVVASIERVDKTAADPAYQRSMRFEYLSEH